MNYDFYLVDKSEVTVCPSTSLALDEEARDVSDECDVTEEPTPES